MFKAVKPFRIVMLSIDLPYPLILSSVKHLKKNFPLCNEKVTTKIFKRFAVNKVLRKLVVDDFSIASTRDLSISKTDHLNFSERHKDVLKTAKGIPPQTQSYQNWYFLSN